MTPILINNILFKNLLIVAIRHFELTQKIIFYLSLNLKRMKVNIEYYFDIFWSYFFYGKCNLIIFSIYFSM